MQTQLSNNMDSSHKPENSCEVWVYQWSNVRHAPSVHVFKEAYQLTNFSQIMYKASLGMEGERMHVFFWLIGFELWHI